MSVRRIDQDHTRFRHIVRGKIKRDLKRFISSGELIGKQGQRYVTIPLPQISLPRFRHGQNKKGVGQGEGADGEQVAGQEADGDGKGQAGEDPGQHMLEVEVSLEDLARILGDELELPNIEPRGKRNLRTAAGRYTGISRAGPMSLRHFKRTFREALKRQIASGTYDPDHPLVIPIREDMRFRALQTRETPQASAVIVYMMDVSGSMGREQKEIVRIEAFWIDTWLRHQYKNLQVHYIVHDAVAHEVDQHTFFHLRESGGTKISSAYELCLQLMRDKYPAQEWNIYPFHFSDGDNWSARDTEHCISLLKDSLLPMSNQFCYGQVKSAYGSGQFKKDLDTAFRADERCVTSDIQDREGILPSIKEFLGEGSLMGNLTPELAALRDETRDLAKSYGLDFYEVLFELVDYDELNMIASYGGFPTRYPHWRFGMEYEHLSKSYTYGLSKIYELVINNDPCYAYLMRSNATTEQKLVMAHVYGHCDFFKNNAWFSHTSRKMMDVMANHGARIRRYMDQYGQDRVENFIDLVQSLDNLIDPYSPYIARGGEKKRSSSGGRGANDVGEQREVRKIAAKDYMDRYINPPEFLRRERARLDQEDLQARQFPERPARDVLKFLLDYAPLETWEGDVLAMLREEAYYFAPQGMTKIMNEGWAVFWHSTLMTRHLCDASEIVNYCDTHSGTLSSGPGQLNPYKLGVELFRDIEERWDRGRFGPEYQACEDPETRRAWNRPTNQGRKKVFEVRRIYNDITFVDEFVTPDFAAAQKMFVYGQDSQTGKLVIVDRDYRKVKNQLLEALTNHGNPIIKVVDANFRNRGELYLVHEWVSGDLQLEEAHMTLKGLWKMWKRPVHIETIEGGKGRLLSCDGETTSAEEITASHPATGRVGMMHKGARGEA